MKRKLYVPLWNTNTSEENLRSYLSDLSAVGADTVFLALDRSLHFADDRREMQATLTRNIARFRASGYTVGVWCSGFGYGNPPGAAEREAVSACTRLRSVSGIDAPGDALCPEDPRFRAHILSLLRDIAKTSPDLIMIDDDMCLSVRPGLGCFCPRHIALLEAALGESLAGRDLPRLFFTGGRNRYRDAWLSVMGETMRAFCRDARAAVDTVSPALRLGFAAGYTSFDIEGADALELSRILAGGTTPFLRLTGAPYWSARALNRFPGKQLADAIEIARIQEAWCRESGIEIFSEGDSYPRPRYHVPSSRLECFDLATAASGGMGALKYLFDYRSRADYERGYFKHHMKNLPFYRAVSDHFDGKSAFGVRVYEKMRKIADATLPADFAHGAGSAEAGSRAEREIMEGFFSPGAALLALSSIPTVFTGRGEVALAFGENVSELDDAPRKLITDLSGAELLLARGRDLGIRRLEPTAPPHSEHCRGERIELFNCHGRFARAALKEGAELVTEFEDGAGRFPGSYRYRDGETEYLVLLFDAYRTREDHALFLSYIRGRTLREFANGFPYMEDAPCLYTLAKRGKDETALLFLNIHEDPIIEGTVMLGRSYRSCTLLGAEGTLDGDRITLHTDLPPFAPLIALLRE